MYKAEALKKYVGQLPWHSRGYIPHFDQPGLLQFITYRCADSLPHEALLKILERIPASRPIERQEAIQELLDQGLGSRPLRYPKTAGCVQENLLHFDGQRYRLIAWCVMLNHVHVLIETFKDFPLNKVTHGWKSYSATRINAMLGRSGTFWQPESFDRAIRDDQHLNRTIEYIEMNPVVARLRKAPADWPYSSAGYRASLNTLQP